VGRIGSPRHFLVAGQAIEGTVKSGTSRPRGSPYRETVRVARQDTPRWCFLAFF